ncbi:MAG: YgiQ family radical SAM protein [Candidatus Nanoarchaeia archaeon]|jgi:uncharacterized radical SAM protein YgiQ
MAYDVIFITGEPFSDNPLCGIAILKRLLEKNGYTVGIIIPEKSEDVTKLGKPNLFFGVTSGSIDSMVRNYTPMNKKRIDDPYTKKMPIIPDRAVIVYSNWIKQHFKDSIVVLGGVEASLRRFTHFDYWSNSLRHSIFIDSKANILVYGNGEKQALELAKRIKEEKDLAGIKGTLIKSRELPNEFILLPSHDEVMTDKLKFCDMQNLLTNYKNLAEKDGNFYLLQYKYPEYTSKDLDEYYELPYNRDSDKSFLKGFEFSVVTHRGCIGNCNFCSLKLLQGDKIISRTKESIIREVNYLTTLPNFKGYIDDLGGPAANMYGMDCNKCEKACIECNNLDKSNKKLIELLKELRKIPKIKKIYVRSGVRYDLTTTPYLKELINYHLSGQLKIAPEHVSKNVLELMNKNKGNLKEFIKTFKELGGKLSYYFMTGHPGSTIKDAQLLGKELKNLENAEAVQLFTPTPMTVSTCMYYTGFNPKTKKPIYVPRTFKEKKMQKRTLI